MGVKCCVKGCVSTQKVTKLYACRRRNTELLPKWLAVIGRKDFIGKPEAEKFRVCDRHFSSNQKFPASPRNHTDLKYDAMPDLNLPEEDIEVTSGSEASFATTKDEHPSASSTKRNSFKKVRKTPENVSSPVKILDSSSIKDEDHSPSTLCNSFKKVCKTPAKTSTSQSPENETSDQKLQKQEFMKAKLKLFAENLEKIDDEVIRSQLHSQITMLVSEIASKDDEIKQLNRQLGQLEEQKPEKNLKNFIVYKCEPDEECETSERVCSKIRRKKDVVNECLTSQNTATASPITEDDTMLPGPEIMKPIRQQNMTCFTTTRSTQCFLRPLHRSKGIQCDITEKSHPSVQNDTEIEWSANCFYSEHEPEIEIIESSSEYEVSGSPPTLSLPVTQIWLPVDK